ncbi:MAG: ribosomal RNA small subunit methyltransferase A [Candidatus Omnitrophica bacterium]|nr:ribosomal RNA small subunit methyltransferase A [Candidatus Omnitrophota bacterium]
MSLIGEAKAALRGMGIFPRKKMGQNFMVDRDTFCFIADALEVKKGEVVLEIGPGLGFLTRELTARQAKVIAVEKDARMAVSVDSRLCGNDKVKMIQKDILAVDLEKDLGIAQPIKIAGNIPYNITSPILEWLIEQRKHVSQTVLTVQWEVAQRLSAQPGTKIWGAISIFTQVYAEIEILRKVGKAYFFPSPKVDSAVIRLRFSPRPRFEIGDQQNFFKIVRRAFQKRRKTVLNALEDAAVPGFEKEALKKALLRADIDPGRRPETLTIPEWARLCYIK